MFDFYEKRRLRKYIYSKPVLAVLLLIAILLCAAVWNMYAKERQTAVKKEQRAAALHDLKERKNGLEEEIDRLKTQQGVEEEIRNRFDVAKKGEDVIVIVDRQDEDKSDADDEEKSLFERIKSFFGM